VGRFGYNTNAAGPACLSRIVGRSSMPLLFLLAALVTITLGVVLIGSVIAGIVLCFVPSWRGFGPFVLFVPTLSALGAVAGAWRLGFAAHSYAPMSALPFWGWVFGLPSGAVVGVLLGLSLAALMRRTMRIAQAAGGNAE
jgi:hypothetical protein